MQKVSLFGSQFHSIVNYPRVCIYLIYIVVVTPAKRKSRLSHRHSSNQKAKGRISVPEELDKEELQKKFEDLRRMPFSLNEGEMKNNYPSQKKNRRRKSKLPKQGKKILNFVLEFYLIESSTDFYG